MLETHRTSKLNGNEVVISKPAFIYLDVPMGSQQVTLTSSQSGTWYGFVRSNHLTIGCQNTISRSTPTHYVSTNRRAHPWSMTDDEVRTQWAAFVSQLQPSGNQSAPSVDVEQALVLADRLGRDNRFRDGGLLAHKLLEQLAARFPQRSELAELVELLASRHRHRQCCCPSS